ncbi:unnamed protein product [Ceratitis capitata]|uniref:(Mediterranean fruit fly) hypothetical protein n=1 Tax=Ceratitis capitata TaxID=7213 RepID=A0A811UAD5_CERCA|nr:unnamed protein product [Ceratitis capitata]
MNKTDIIAVIYHPYYPTINHSNMSTLKHSFRIKNLIVAEYNAESASTVDIGKETFLSETQRIL